MDLLETRLEALRAGSESADPSVVSQCVSFVEKQCKGGDEEVQLSLIEDLYLHLDYLFVSMYKHSNNPSEKAPLSTEQTQTLWRALVASNFMSSLPIVDQKLIVNEQVFEEWKGPRKGVFVLGQCLGCLMAEQAGSSLSIDYVDPSTAIASLAVNISGKKCDDGQVARALPMALPWIIDILESPFCKTTLKGSNAIGIRSIFRDIIFRVLLKYEQIDSLIMDSIISAISLCHKDCVEMCDSLWMEEELRELMIWLVKTVLIDDEVVTGPKFALERLCPLLAAVSGSPIGAQHVVDLISSIPVLVADRTADRRQVMEQVGDDGSLWLLLVREGEQLVVVVGGVEIVIPSGTTGSQRGDQRRVKWNLSFNGFEFMYRNLLPYLPLIHSIVKQLGFEALPQPQVVPLFAESKVPDLALLLGLNIRECLDDQDGVDPNTLVLLLETFSELKDIFNHVGMQSLDLLSETTRGLLYVLKELAASNSADMTHVELMSAIIRLVPFEKVVSILADSLSIWLKYDPIVIAMAHSIIKTPTTSNVPTELMTRMGELLDLPCIGALAKCAPSTTIHLDVQVVVEHLPDSADLLTNMVRQQGIMFTAPQYQQIIKTKSVQILDSSSETHVGQLLALGLLEEAVKIYTESCKTDQVGPFILAICRLLSTSTDYDNVIKLVKEYVNKCKESAKRWEAMIRLNMIKSTDCDLISGILDEYPELAALEQIYSSNMSMILERPNCLLCLGNLHHFKDQLSAISPTENMIPSMIKYPELLELLPSSLVYLELLKSAANDGAFLSNWIVQICTKIPSPAQVSRTIQSLSLAPLFFTRPNLEKHKLLAECLSKHRDLQLLLIVEMGLLEAVASVSVNTVHQLVFDLLTIPLPQPVLSRMATLLTGTRLYDLHWLACMVKLADQADDTVLLLLREHILQVGLSCEGDERWRLLSGSLLFRLAK